MAGVLERAPSRPNKPSKIPIISRKKGRGLSNVGGVCARPWGESDDGARCPGDWNAGRLDPINRVIWHKTLIFSRNKGRGLTNVGGASARAWGESKDGAWCQEDRDGGRVDPINRVIWDKTLIFSRKKGRGLTKAGGACVRAWGESKDAAQCPGNRGGGRLNPINRVIWHKTLIFSRNKGRGLTKVGGAYARA